MFLSNPYSANFYSVPHPHVPYSGPIPNGAHPGKQIFITGEVPSNATKFSIDLETHYGSAFHFNPRFNENCVVRNACNNGAWGPEERNGPIAQPFQRGRRFELIIGVEPDRFTVTVNGQNCFEFRHRMPPQDIQRIGVNGDVRLHQLSFGDNQRGNEVRPGPGPCRVPIRGVNPGKLIQILGNTLPHTQRFAINLEAGGDIPLHASVRFDEGNVVVRNSLFGGSWGMEERHHGPFPFTRGAPFEVLILCEGNAWKMAVNGQHFIEFAHRAPYNFVNQLFIEGDVQITAVREY